MRVKSARTRVGAMAAMLALLASPALAQNYECDRLRGEIAAVNPGLSRDAGRYADAAQKQQNELARTSAYAQSIGCNNRQFLIFGSPPPPQCGGLEAQIQKMRGNLAGLQARMRAGDGDARRQALQARYDATCRPRAGGLFDSLFGGDPNMRRQVPLEDYNPPREVRDEDTDRPRNGSLAVCVRACDGGYFPVSYSARPSRYDALADLCKAQCPGAEVSLYTMPASGNIDQAVSPDGDSYTDMPNAGKFRKTYSPACACKPPNKSWVEALAQAEELLDRKSKSDIIVTVEKADQLSRPKGAPLSPDKVRAALRGSAAPEAANTDDKSAAPADPAPAPKDGKSRPAVRIVGPKL